MTNAENNGDDDAYDKGAETSSWVPLSTSAIHDDMYDAVSCAPPLEQALQRVAGDPDTLHTSAAAIDGEQQAEKEDETEEEEERRQRQTHDAAVRALRRRGRGVDQVAAWRTMRRLAAERYDVFMRAADTDSRV